MPIHDGGLRIREMRKLIDFIYPPVCHICGRRLSDRESFLCFRCIEELPRTLYHRIQDNNMEMRFAGLFEFERATALCFYSRHSKFSQLIQDFKYRKMPGLARRMGEIMGEELNMSGFFNGIDFIIPIPMHYIKRWERGYNQAKCLAEGVSGATNIPIKQNLFATKSHRTQTTMTAEQRRVNLKDCFGIKNIKELENKHILIIDDVCTTGTTLASAAEILAVRVPGIRISLLTLGVTF